jgi:hypothetical protein
LYLNEELERVKKLRDQVQVWHVDSEELTGSKEARFYLMIGDYKIESEDIAFGKQRRR